MNIVNEEFITQYSDIFKTQLNEPTIGGTVPHYNPSMANAFNEILEITKAKTILEIGFNVGGSALLFLSLDPNLIYHSVDVNMANTKSIEYFNLTYPKFSFFNLKSSTLIPSKGDLLESYDLMFIDGDHSSEAVIDDINTCLTFKPKYLLFDDVVHPHHSYIKTIITEDFKDALSPVKLYEFPHIWAGLSLMLCKVN